DRSAKKPCRTCTCCLRKNGRAGGQQQSENGREPSDRQHARFIFLRPLIIKPIWIDPPLCAGIMSLPQLAAPSSTMSSEPITASFVAQIQATAATLSRAMQAAGGIAGAGHIGHIGGMALCSRRCKCLDHRGVMTIVKDTAVVPTVRV